MTDDIERWRAHARDQALSQSVCLEKFFRELIVRRLIPWRLKVRLPKVKAIGYFFDGFMTRAPRGHHYTLFEHHTTGP